MRNPMRQAIGQQHLKMCISVTNISNSRSAPQKFRFPVSSPNWKTWHHEASFGWIRVELSLQQGHLFFYWFVTVPTPPYHPTILEPDVDCYLSSLSPFTCNMAALHLSIFIHSHCLPAARRTQVCNLQTPHAEQMASHPVLLALS